MTSEDVLAGGSGYRAQTLATQRASGIGLLRQVRLGDHRVEPAPLSSSAGTTATCSTRRATACACCRSSSTPSFYVRQRGLRACPPRRMAAMGVFARKLVRRYGPRGSLWRQNPGVRKVPIKSWQIWNEPNLRIYWCGRPRARAYARMLRVVGKSIRRVHRRAEIVTAGLPPSELSGTVLAAALHSPALSDRRAALVQHARDQLVRQEPPRARKPAPRRAPHHEPPRRPARADLAHGARLGRQRPAPPLRGRRAWPGQAHRTPVPIPQAQSRSPSPTRRRLLLLARRTPLPAAVQGHVGPPHRAAPRGRQSQAGLPRIPQGGQGLRQILARRDRRSP